MFVSITRIPKTRVCVQDTKTTMSGFRICCNLFTGVQPTFGWINKFDTSGFI